MARRSKKRVPRGRFLLRWLGVGTLAFIAFLYWQPLRSYLGTRDAVKQQSAEVRALREQKLRLERRLAESDTAASGDPRSAAARVRRARRRLYIVKGIAPGVTSTSRETTNLVGLEHDRELVAKQLGRPPRAFARVVVRCPFGRPAVTEQSPYDDSGAPFPTTYYVTCRHLVAAISQARGGRRRGALVRAGATGARPRREPRPRHGGAAARPHRARRGPHRQRPRSSLQLGIGGSRNPEQLKCLHAHVAFALARPGYELGERIAEEIVPLWPERCCMEGADAVPMIGRP